MIPKKIHYCWLSDDPFPEKIRRCIDSWKEKLPDYEIIRWDLQRFPLEKCNWVRQAYETKKYAFAADYIRLYALATEGGIYLDSDVEVLKSFDDLLDYPYFICKENSPQGIEAATIGAEPGCGWIRKCLDYYKDKNFINEKGEQNNRVLPSIIKEVITHNYTLQEVVSPIDIMRDEKNVYMLPSDYFSPKNYVSKKLRLTLNTYSIHHFAGTWQPQWKKILLRIWVPLSVKFPYITNSIKYLWKG